MKRAYRLTISGIVFYDDAIPRDGELRTDFENAGKATFEELKELREVACQELHEEAGLDTIKITLEEVPYG